jgi:hypothetical protein
VAWGRPTKAIDRRDVDVLTVTAALVEALVLLEAVGR